MIGVDSLTSLTIVYLSKNKNQNILILTLDQVLNRRWLVFGSQFSISLVDQVGPLDLDHSVE